MRMKRGFVAFYQGVMIGSIILLLLGMSQAYYTSVQLENPKFGQCIGTSCVGDIVKNKLSQYYGVTVLSVSQVNYISTDPKLNRAAWSMQVVLGGGQSIEGLVSNDSIKSGDKQGEDSFSLKFRMYPEKCNYQVTPVKLPVTTYLDKSNSYYEDNWGECFVNPDNCALTLCGRHLPSGSIPFTIGGNVLYGKKANSYIVHCMYGTHDGIFGKVSLANTEFTSTITLEKTGETPVSATISNVGNASVMLGNIGYAQWVGSFVTGNPCPDANLVHGVYRYSSKGWATVNPTVDSAYSGLISSLDNCFDSTLLGLGSVKNCEINFNNGVESIFTSSKKLSENQVILGESTESRGLISLEHDRAVNAPVLLLVLDANWVGVRIPESKPQILSVTSNSFSTKGYIVTEIKNIGDEEGVFDLVAKCSSPYIGITETTKRTPGIAPSGSAKVSIQLTSNVVTTVSTTCTVTARNPQPPYYDTSQTVQVTAKPITTCVPSSQRCDGNVITQCNSDGTGYTVKVKECSYGCIAGNPPYCQAGPTVTPGAGPTGCAPTDFMCQFMAMLIPFLAQAVFWILVIGFLIFIGYVTITIIIPKVIVGVIFKR